VGEGLTSCWVGIGLVELEGDAFYEMTEIVRATDDVRVGLGGSASDGYGPSVGMIGVDGFAFFGGENGCGVAVDDGS
jgi:hypothetical protein